jgi:sortase A
MDLRRAMRGVGKTLIAAGTIILLFVAYQLWGTGLAEHRSQRKLNRELARILPGPAQPVPMAVPAPPPPPEGEAVAVIRIPKIGLDKAVVQGVGLADLKKGPGHYPTTPMPGQPGNAAIAGHRTTYGAPFFDLNELAAGDPILVTTQQGRFRYEVTGSKVVSPNETSVLDASRDNRLTLTTCNPRFSARERLIVVAALKGEAASAPPPGAEPAPAPSLGEAEEAGLSGRNAANGPAIAWGTAAALVALVSWGLGRLWRRWPAYLLGLPPFLVVLFIFFENFSRLLPSNF